MASNVSVISERSSRSSFTSILKSYDSSQKDKVRNSFINKVRFELPKQKNIKAVITEVQEQQNYKLMGEFVAYLNGTTMEDKELLQIINEAHSIVQQLGPKFTPLVEAVLKKFCLKCSPELLKAYADFYVDLLVAHNTYLSYGITRLVQLWLPDISSFDMDNDIHDGLKNILSDEWKNESLVVHDLLERLFKAMPLAFNAILDAINTNFPYFKKPTPLIVGFVYNLMKFMQCNLMFTENIMLILLDRLVTMDVNAPRCEIEECEDTDDEYDGENDEKLEKANIEKQEKEAKDDEDGNLTCMIHPIARTLDMCLLELYKLFNTINSSQPFNKDQLNGLKFWKLLIRTFDTVILPIHNAHHVQFIMFYYGNLKVSYAEMFLSSLWEKIKNPNTSAVIRQVAVAYVASFLARSKTIGLNLLKDNISAMSTWCHQYIKNSDQQYSVNNSIRAHLVFYAMCQAVFYVIAFRSRDLTKDRKSLLFLQSLQLSALVTCNLNPLRVCLPAVATAFAGVTRTYQLAYCHAILERNARRKLASVYAYGMATPEETLDTFFPFDPYILKLSSKFIKPFYMEYRASEGEEYSSPNEQTFTNLEAYRKRCLSENQEDHNDIDDFLVPLDKKQKLATSDSTKEVENI